MNNRPIRLLTSGRAGLGAGALITAVVLLIALGAVWTPVAFADGCPDAEVTFARGTGEPPESGALARRSSTRCASRLAWRSEYTR